MKGFLPNSIFGQHDTKTNRLVLANLQENLIDV